MRRSFLLLLVFRVAEAAPATTGPASDLNAIIIRVDQFVRVTPYGTTNRSGFQKLEDVTDDKVDVAGLFNMVGDLFANGIIGQFEDKGRGLERFRKLYINTNRTSETLSEKLIQLFDKFNSYDVFREVLDVIIYAKDRGVPRSGPVLRAIRNVFQAIFSRSAAFYAEINGATAAQLRLQYPFDDNEVDDNRCYSSKVDDICSDLGWTHDAPVVDYTMQAFLRIMGPGCESEITEDPTCFHKFLIRHHNYSEGQYEGFVHNLAYILADERAIYGFCTRIQQARNNAVTPSKSTITDQLATLQKRLRDARCVLTENVSPCPTEETPTITHISGLLPGESAHGLPVDEILHEDRTKCVPRVQTTAGTGASQRTRQDLNEYKALVFYAANEDTEYCIRNGTRGDVYSSTHDNVRFLVARYDQTQITNAKRELNVTSLVPKIQQALSEIDAENQCNRLTKIDEKLNGALSKFGPVADIKCARKFVWYELGHRYFQAAWTNSVDIPTEDESDYSSKCGKIVAFP